MSGSHWRRRYCRRWRWRWHWRRWRWVLEVLTWPFTPLSLYGDAHGNCQWGKSNRSSHVCEDVRFCSIHRRTRRWRSTAQAELLQLSGACDGLHRAERRARLELVDEASCVTASQRRGGSTRFADDH